MTLQSTPPSWNRVSETGGLPDQFERFGQDRNWGSAVAVRIGPARGRIHIIRDGDERLIQIQNSRFIYNWRKQQQGYPSYGQLLPEFRERFCDFCAFLDEMGLGAPGVNQWEVTYVNPLEQGDLWQLPSDWKAILPGLYIPGQHVPGLDFESLDGQWRLVIGENRGRLHVSLQHGIVAGPPPNREVVILQFTARGPVDEAHGMDLWSGFDLGHRAIVQCFTAMTSDDAHKRWQRRP